MPSMADGSDRPEASDDLVLARCAVRGDRAAIAQLSERLRHVPRALRVLDHRNGNLLRQEELADLVQDVLVLIWRKLSEYEPLSPLEGWAYGICVLEYRNAVRRGRRQRQEAHAIASHGAAPAAAAHDPDPWAFEELHESLRRIGRVEAKVIRLKHFEGHTFDEIGRQLGLSPNTVKTRYYRGLKELRPLLELRGEASRGARE
jgi:RNA polymerase sigma-70 factor (ECF subfamily)